MSRTIRTKVYQFSELSDKVRPEVIREFVLKAFSKAEVKEMGRDEYDTVYNNIAIMLHKNNEYEFKADGTRF